MSGVSDMEDVLDERIFDYLTTFMSWDRATWSPAIATLRDMATLAQDLADMMEDELETAEERRRN